MFQSVSIISLYNPLFQCFETPEIKTGIFTFSRACFNTRNGAWYFHLFQSLFQLFQNVSKQLKRSDLVNFLHVSVCFNNFPIYSIVSVFWNTRNGAWYFHLFQSLFPFCFQTFRNNWNFLIYPIFFMFQSISIISLYNPLFQCFKRPEMGSGIFTFSRACFNFVLKRFEQLKHSIISLYNPLFQYFETPEMGPGIFNFSKACFNFVS